MNVDKFPSEVLAEPVKNLTLSNGDYIVAFIVINPAGVMGFGFDASLIQAAIGQKPESTGVLLASCDALKTAIQRFHDQTVTGEGSMGIATSTAN